jgi:hypothetical protein
MTDLVAFVRACLDEDERVARAAIRPERIDGWANPPLPADSGHWVVKSEVSEIDDPDDWYAIEDEQSREIVVYNESRPDSDQAAHIARHDPARVLAEVAAKRKLLLAYNSAVIDEGLFHRQTDSVAYHQAVARVSAWTYVVQQLAQPYAGRPGWREEWRA